MWGDMWVVLVRGRRVDTDRKTRDALFKFLSNSYGYLMEGTKVGDRCRGPFSLRNLG